MSVWCLICVFLSVLMEVPQLGASDSEVGIGGGGEKKGEWWQNDLISLRAGQTSNSLNFSISARQ